MSITDFVLTNSKSQGRSQFKTSASREIENWANLEEYERASQSIARQIGQLNDNVTEDRLLLTKIMELSKERFKCMTQNNYDRKVFLERQQRKARTMSGLLKGIDATTYLRNIGLGTASMSESDHIKKQYAGKKALLREIIENRRAQERPRARSKFSLPLPVDEFPDMDDSPDLEEARRILGDVLDSWRRPASKASVMSIKALVANICLQDSEQNQTKNEDKLKERVMSPLTKSRTKLLKMRPLTDPRYRKLETALCESNLPYGGTFRPVVTIVHQIDTLHSPHKRNMITFQQINGKRMNPRIKSYMEDRGVLPRL